MTVDVERKGKKRIEVLFDYDPEKVKLIRQVSGRSFLRDPYNHWTVPLDMAVCRQLRELFGNELRIGPALRSWAQEAKREQDRLGSIAMANYADLPVLMKKLPPLWRALYFGPLRRTALKNGICESDLDFAEHVFSFIAGVPPWSRGSYQTADVRFLADAPAPLNANHQGLGKTVEAIAEIFEAGREEGWHLIIAPSSAVDGTWEPELEAWTASVADKVGIFACYGKRADREHTLRAAIESSKPINFVVVNPAMVKFNKDPSNSGPMVIRAKEKEYRLACKCSRIKAAHWHYEPSYPELMDVFWDTIINDEVHKGNVRNQRTITGHSMMELKLNDGGKPVGMSGTPMKKKGADIWGILHWLRPDVFTSFWNFAGQFFHIEKNPFGQKVGELREEREAEFYRTLAPYVVRRTKREVLPWLPDKMHIPVMVTLTEKQQRQYDKMRDEGIALFEDAEIPQTSVLAEFTRLQQFANCYHTVAGGQMRPAADESAKLDALFEKLDEAGILDGSSNEQTVIFSRFKEMIVAVMARMDKLKVDYGVISGHTRDRRRLIEAFQKGELPVMLVVTSAGGVSLTLDAADTAHFIEPSWAPDEQEQAEDRIHRASRMHQVTIYTYLARNTIDEYVMETAFDKDEQHKRILDVRRLILANARDQ